MKITLQEGNILYHTKYLIKPAKEKRRKMM